MILIAKKKHQLGTAVMQKTSYNNIQLSSNQLLTNLGSVLSDDQINQLAKDKKLVFRSRLFSPAIFLRTAVEILNRDKEYSLRSIYYEYADNWIIPKFGG